MCETHNLLVVHKPTIYEWVDSLDIESIDLLDGSLYNLLKTSIYIYIYIEGWVQVTPGVILSNVISPNNLI